MAEDVLFFVAGFFGLIDSEANRVLASAVVFLGFLQVTAFVLNLIFVKGGYDIWRRSEEDAANDGFRTEKKVFLFSLLYLFMHFGALLAEAGLRSYGLGGW